MQQPDGPQIPSSEIHAKSPEIAPDHLDLNLPIPDEPLPGYHDLPLSSVYARNAVIMSETVYDDAYFARRLARMITEPFVMH